MAAAVKIKISPMTRLFGAAAGAATVYFVSKKMGKRPDIKFIAAGAVVGAIIPKPTLIIGGITVVAGLAFYAGKNHDRLNSKWI